jgi:hypothetical protein
MTLSALGIFSAAGVSGVLPAYELISTTILGTTESSVVFSSLATYSTTYKHLQIRATARTNRGAPNDLDDIGLRFNGDSVSTYNQHNLRGDGSGSPTAGAIDRTGIYIARAASVSANANVFSAFVTDILDPYAAKNKTVRTLDGVMTGAGSSRVWLSSGLWRETTSLTSITLYSQQGASFIAGSRFSLYGIRG